MRYAAPVAMPASLGEWLGAELEARGVEAASLYARAVLSILLHSEGAEAELEMDPDPQTYWNPRTAFELELKLERHVRETKRGRPSKKSFGSKTSNSYHQSKRSSNVSINNGKNQGHNGNVRRRPHSWNGDEETLKKCAAIECLLSATDDSQWGPVEKLVDELCARLKLLQMEQQSGANNTNGGPISHRWTTHGSAPECVEAFSSSDTDSFTSVSSPEGSDMAEDYRQAFPPLEYLSDSDQVDSCLSSSSNGRIVDDIALSQGVQQPSEPVWNVRKSTGKPQSRVRFVRMPGTRLSPQLPQPLSNQPSKSVGSTCEVRNTVYGESCASEAYFGDCSRDSSMERAPTPPTSTIKGRLYERVAEVVESKAESALNVALTSAFNSFCHVQENIQPAIVQAGSESGWNGTQWTPPASDSSSIWAPLECDWTLIGSEASFSSWPLESSHRVPPDAAVQLSLALLNHHPEHSSFSPVLAKSLQKALPKNSKLYEWLASFTLNAGEIKEPELGEKDPSCEVESILNEPGFGEEEEEPENLLTSPKTHFCPIQHEKDAEVQVSDGATFDVDAQPEEVHFLRSPSGALYLPECEESTDGWKRWAKYMIYKSPPSPSPLALAFEAAENEEPKQTSRPTTPFTLKFRVVQTEKCCQTDSRIAVVDHDKSPTSPLAISSPFTAKFSTSPTSGLLGAGDVWKFDAQLVTKDLIEELKSEENSMKTEENDQDGKEEELDGLLSEVWNVAGALVDIDPESNEETAELPVEEPSKSIDGSTAVASAEEESVVPTFDAVVERQDVQEEFDLDELWNPFMDETGEEQVDVCEWVPQMYVPEEGCETWLEEEMLAESWPPPNIPVEYLDDEFFEEIYGSLDSMKASNAAAGTSSGAGGGKNSRRRRRRTSQKQQPSRRPKRPCSFFVEGECRRHDCKFSHDLGSIPCRFWMESGCFKGDECPFMHAIPPTKEDERNRSSGDELSESYGSEEAEPHRLDRGAKTGQSRKKFQFDLEADFPSLTQAVDVKQRPGPVISQSRPIAITQGFAAADHTSTTAASSLEIGAEVVSASALKRRRKRFPCQRVSTSNVAGTSSESSPVETVSSHLAPVGKRSRKNKLSLCTITASNTINTKRDKPNKKHAASATNTAVAVTQSDRRRTKSEHDSDGNLASCSAADSRARFPSIYKEG